MTAPPAGSYIRKDSVFRDWVKGMHTVVFLFRSLPTTGSSIGGTAKLTGIERECS